MNRRLFGDFIFEVQSLSEQFPMAHLSVQQTLLEFEVEYNGVFLRYGCANYWHLPCRLQAVVHSLLVRLCDDNVSHMWLVMVSNGEWDLTTVFKSSVMCAVRF